ncbi:MAG: transmembrane 220 family protein [Bacteroidetes bacterium]|nr:transmembrane 220 family protein [Bacteroidota bacterium]
MFISFAAVQYNDPDPWLWIPVYLIFAGLNISLMYKPLHPLVYAFAAVDAVIFAWFQWPDHWEGIGESMLTTNMERARESMGLVICALSAVVCYFVATRPGTAIGKKGDNLTPPGNPA